MSNFSVIQSGESCGCSGGSSEVPSNQPVSLADQIIVRSKPGILIGNIIKEYIENGKKVYELDDFNLIKPVIEFSNDFESPNEVGVTIPTVTFDGEISQGSYPITFRQIVPAPGGPVLDLTVPFTFTATGVTRETPGDAQVFTITVTDDHGNQSIKQSKVPFKNAFYQGFNPASSLDQTAIKALVNKNLIDSILQQYGGIKTYVVPSSPAVPAYIYWCAPVGTPIIGSASLNGFDLPLVALSNVVVTNPNNGALTLSYWVKRTANQIDPGTYQIFVA